MEYKPEARALIKKQQRAAITWIITLQLKYFFCGESNQMVEFVTMKNNLRAWNPLIYHAEVPLALYRDDSCLQPGKKGIPIGRTSLGRTAAATRRKILRWKYMTYSGSTSPMESGKSISIYASGIWQASATSTHQHYQRTTRHAPLDCSRDAPSPTAIIFTARPHMKKLITWSIYWISQSRIPTRSRRSVQVIKGIKVMVK